MMWRPPWQNTFPHAVESHLAKILRKSGDCTRMQGLRRCDRITLRDAALTVLWLGLGLVRGWWFVVWFVVVVRGSWWWFVVLGSRFVGQSGRGRTADSHARTGVKLPLLNWFGFPTVVYGTLIETERADLHG